ncbi:MAG: DUF2267 domain-containing protein [Deltaproteobacteria bacterium]|nr:DUF2267 domain-containing protein [Deltaproteobacteria bacterium]
MTMTGLDVFDRSIHAANDWLKDIMYELGTEDRHRAYLALRATLQALRDRLSVNEAAQLGAQLPLLIRGFYYEGWTPSGKPLKERHKKDFLAHIQDQFGPDGIDAESVARAVFKMLHFRVSKGAIQDLKGVMPKELLELWPQTP